MPPDRRYHRAQHLVDRVAWHKESSAVNASSGRATDKRAVQKKFRLEKSTWIEKKAVAERAAVEQVVAETGAAAEKDTTATAVLRKFVADMVQNAEKTTSPAVALMEVVNEIDQKSAPGGWLEAADGAAAEYTTPQKSLGRTFASEVITPPKLCHDQHDVPLIHGKPYHSLLLNVFSTTAALPSDIDSRTVAVLDALHRAERLEDACALLQDTLHGVPREGKVGNWSGYIHKLLVRILDPHWHSMKSATRDVLESMANELHVAICALGGHCKLLALGKAYTKAWDQVRGARIAAPTLPKFIAKFPDLFMVTCVDGVDYVQVQCTIVEPCRLLGTCDQCSHELHGAPCPWHPHAGEVKEVIEQHLQPTMRVCLKDGIELEIHRVSTPKQSNQVCLHARSRENLAESTLDAKDIVCARWVAWKSVSEIKQPVLLKSGHGVEFNHARAQVFASISRIPQCRRSRNHKAVILDARLRNYTAMIESGWRREDVLIVEYLPLTALYQQSLGADVFCGRLEEVLHSPPTEPGWIKQHVEDTVAVYVDLCGDCEGKEWKTPLSAALEGLPKLEMYMIARNMRGAGRVPRLKGFFEIGSFFDHGVECWLFLRCAYKEVEVLKQRVDQARCEAGLPREQQQWQCRICSRIECSYTGEPRMCSHCRRSGTMKPRRWCAWCKTRADLRGLQCDPRHPDVMYCGACWKQWADERRVAREL